MVIHYPVLREYDLSHISSCSLEDKYIKWCVKEEEKGLFAFSFEDPP